MTLIETGKEHNQLRENEVRGEVNVRERVMRVSSIDNMYIYERETLK